MTHLKFIMSEQIKLQNEAKRIAKESTRLEKFFKAGRYKRLIAVEMELLQNAELMDAILGLCYRSNIHLIYAYQELITPKVKKS
jgi:hypothetical protein